MRASIICSSLTVALLLCAAVASPALCHGMDDIGRGAVLSESDAFSLLESYDSRQRALQLGAGPVPPALCAGVPRDSHYNVTVRGRVFFFAVSLCAVANMTPASPVAPGANCTPAGYLRVVEKAAGGTDTTCGASEIIYTASSVERATPARVELAFARAYDGPGRSENLTLVVECGDADPVPQGEFLVVTNVSGSTASELRVWARARACGVTADAGEKPKNVAAMAVAIVIVLMFVIGFAAVLYRAKLAGDRLRDLKRKRGDRVYLG